MHFRPLGETFHDFLLNVVKWTLTEEWWNRERVQPAAHQHCVVRWIENTREAHSRVERFEADGSRSRRASGLTWSLLQLGYDLYCLQAKNALPQFMVDRLRERRSFQAARYEVAAGAIMQRTGFDVAFLQDDEQDRKHCEFIATCRSTQVRIGVEAKSRIRPGVLNEPGDRQPSDDIRGFANLVRKAKKQAPDLPFFVFLDVNIPAGGQMSLDSGWVKDLREALSNTPTAEEPDAYSAIFATNFAGHYANGDETEMRTEWVTILPQHSRWPARAEAVRVAETLPRYTTLPRQV